MMMLLMMLMLLEEHADEVHHDRRPLRTASKTASRVVVADILRQISNDAIVNHTSPRAVHSRHPLPADSQPARKGPSHGRRKHAQKNGKGRAYVSRYTLADRQTDTQTHTNRYTYHNIS